MKRVGQKIDKSKLLYGMPEKVQDDAYSKHVRTLPCIVTGSYATDTMAIDPAHIRMYADGSLSSKPSDWFIVPLRHDLHQLQHQIGEQRFWRAVINGDIEGAQGDLLLFRILHAFSGQIYRDWKNNGG